MKVLFKTVLVLLFGAMTTTAHAANHPFVGWKTIPPASPELVINSLKVAMQNTVPGTITAEGDTIYATKQSYIDVWGEALYNEILAAPVASFSFLKSSGGGQNNAIDEDGNAVPCSRLDPGTYTVWLTAKKLEIAKWGGTACLNAVGVIQRAAFKPKPAPTPNSSNSNPWTQQININQAPATAQGLSAIEYLGWSSIAEAKQLNAMHAGADFFKDGATFAASLRTTTSSTGGLGAQNLYISAAPAGGGGGQSTNSTSFQKRDISYSEPGLGVKNWGIGLGSFLIGGAEMLRAVNNDRHDFNINSVNQNYNYTAGSGGTCRLHPNCDCTPGGTGGGTRVYNTSDLNPYGSVATNTTGTVREYNTSSPSPYVATNYGQGVNSLTGNSNNGRTYNTGIDLTY